MAALRGDQARFGIGISFASLRRFWAVAARRNSSRAPVGPSQSKPIELENAFEMGEQHLDLLAQSARHVALPRLGDRTRHVTRALVD